MRFNWASRYETERQAAHPATEWDVSLLVSGQLHTIRLDYPGGLRSLVQPKPPKTHNLLGGTLGGNSTDALYKAFHDFLKQCVVVGDTIVTPLDVAQGIDPTAGGQRLPVPDNTVPGRPDHKRGQ